MRPALAAASGVGSWRMAELSSYPVRPVNGRAPDAISCRMTPSAHTSLRASAGRPRSCSGAMYGIVPTTAPGCVNDKSARVLKSPPTSSLIDLARPKSRTLMRASGVIITFALFRSRCTTPRSCACPRASASCRPMRITSSIGSVRSTRRRLNGAPSTNSIAIYARPPASPTS